MLVQEGDITRVAVDVIVNAANCTLLGGGGVDGAIHRVAGPALRAECETLGGCPTGEARITKGHGLSCKHIVHTVGPVWRGGQNREMALLAACYRNSLQLAVSAGARTVAFPSISTGAYHFPGDKASLVAIGEVRNFLSTDKSIEKVIFVCLGRDMYETYLRTLDQMLPA